MCLTLSCHYSFADYLHGGSSKGRDPATGTPHGAPFERNWLTMGMFAIVTALQVMWSAWTLPVTLPLLLVFFPVTSLVGFVAPFCSIFATQKGVALVVKRAAGGPEKEEEEEKVEDEGRSEGAASKVLDKPSSRHLVSFEGTVFALKGSATQFVGVPILAFSLLPFYANGFGWWAEGAEAFLADVFDLPRLWRHFTMSFAWPVFEYPRMYLPLLVAVVLVVLQLSIKAIKWLLRDGYRFLKMRDAASKAVLDRAAILPQAILSWRFFGAASDVSKAALETTWKRGQRDLAAARKTWREQGWKKDWTGKQYHDKGAKFSEQQRALNVAFCVCSYFLGTITLAYPAWFAVVQARAMLFSNEASDKDVDDWASTEDAMPYRRLEVQGGSDQITKITVQVVCHRLVWMTHISLDNCKMIVMTTVELAGQLKCLASLKALSLDGCKGISGERRFILRCSLFEVLL